MAYDYMREREAIFTEEGQCMFLAIRDNIQSKLKIAGAIRGQEAISVVTGSSWAMMACVERLVELKELREIPTEGAWQHKVFVAGY